MISIIIPAYNNEKKIEVCLKSLMKQTCSDIEIIVVNDGSSDMTGKIVDKVSQLDHRIIAVHKPNGGVSSARNVGISKATGEYIMFVDSDDEVESNYCEEMLKAMLQSNADMIVCGYIVNQETRIVLPTEKDLIKILQSQEAFLELYLNNRTCICVPWNKMYKREKILDGFDEERAWGEDLIFNINYLQNCSSVALLGKSLYHYTVNNIGTSLNKNSYQIIQNLKKNLDCIMQYFRNDIETLQRLQDQYYYEFYYYCKLICKTDYEKVRMFCREMLEIGNYKDIVNDIMPITTKAKILKFALKKGLFLIVFMLIWIQEVLKEGVKE